MNYRRTQVISNWYKENYGSCPFTSHATFNDLFIHLECKHDMMVFEVIGCSDKDVVQRVMSDYADIRGTTITNIERLDLCIHPHFYDMVWGPLVSMEEYAYFNDISSSSIRQKISRNTMHGFIKTGKVYLIHKYFPYIDLRHIDPENFDQAVSAFFTLLNKNRKKDGLELTTFEILDMEREIFYQKKKEADNENIYKKALLSLIENGLITKRELSLSLSVPLDKIDDFI